MATADNISGSNDGMPSGGDYEIMPYVSMPIAYTDPAHLTALAILLGLKASVPERARVLELGCASGGNIIPLALRFPLAHFTGIDIARAHIEEGQRRLALLGLRNIELRQADLAKFAPVAESYDFIICHGVYSWVPHAVQDAIFRICGVALAPEGMAVISYNVLPGWHLRNVVRGICLHHVNAGDPPRQRVRRAREALNQIAAASSETDPYGLMLRKEAKRLETQPSSYILGEFLAPHNAPCTIQEFAGRAGQFGLRYLCDGDPATQLAADGGLAWGEAAGRERLDSEQHSDFVTGRTFRRTVLVRSGRAIPAGSPPLLERVRTLHISSALLADVTGSREGTTAFQDARGRAIGTTDADIAAALGRLAECFPATQTLSQLAVAADGSIVPGLEARLAQIVLKMLAGGQASISSLPLSVGRSGSQRPEVWPLARIEAAAGQPWVTSRRHAGVAINRVLAALIPELDGSRDRDQLVAQLADALRRGTVELPQQQNVPAATTADGLRHLARDQVERSLAYLAINALLEQDPMGGNP